MPAVAQFTVAELAQKVDSSDQVQNYQARLALSRMEIAAGAADKAVERKQLAAELAAAISATKEVADPKKPKDKPKLAPTASVRVRNTLIRTLAGVATEAEVPTLVAALDDFDVREMARWALDRMTAQGATAALCAAATQAVGVEFRVGVLNSLGRKATASNVLAALKACAADADAEVRLAAIEALANHADAANDAVITAAFEQRKPGSRRGTTRVTRARLRLAERLARAGQKDAAKKILADIAGQTDPVQKDAATAALKSLS